MQKKWKNQKANQQNQKKQKQNKRVKKGEKKDSQKGKIWEKNGLVHLHFCLLFRFVRFSQKGEKWAKSPPPKKKKTK